MKRMLFTMIALSGIFSGMAPRAFAQESSAAQTITTAQHSIQPTSGAISVPRLVQFNGTLKDVAARPVAGVASVSFAIYAEQDGGTALWSETQNVLADSNGHYNVLLGSATSNGVPAELFGTGQSRWLGITVARQPEMARVMMASVPYALKAADADTLGGLPASEYVTTRSLAARSSVGATNGTPILAAPQVAVGGPTPFATPTGSGTTNFIPIWTSSSVLANSLLFQTGGNVGINTTTPAETLDVNGNSIFRGSFQLPPGHPATSASGFESHSFQFQASSFNSGTAKSTTQSFGFRAEPLNNNTSNPSAVLDLFFIPNGGSSFQNTGVSFSAAGVTSAPSLQLTSNSSTPNTLLTLSNNSTTIHDAINIDFNPVTATGATVPAARWSVEDDGDDSAYMTFGIRNMGSVSNGLKNVISVDSYDETTFAGNVFILGTLSKVSGSFKIDDPIDPAGKYLSHSFVESPDMMNIYNGNAVLDGHGQAVIQMPEWFGALNQDFRYTLTAIGTAAPKLHIAEEMRDNRFTIAGGKKGQKVSWQVTGIRHDAYAEAHRIPTEEMKPPNEQGYYITPELFGAGPDKSIMAVRHRHSASPAASTETPTAAPVSEGAAEQGSTKQAGGSTD
ncbi:MAG TPA: hypothetical protein VGD60_02530 [Candidatus Acidoferrales bacterium]